MLSEPKVVERREQPHLGIRGRVPMGEIGAFIDESFPELLTYLEAHGVTRAGPPSLRYNVIDMERELEIEVGASRPSSSPIKGGSSPAPYLLGATARSRIPGSTAA